MAFTLGAAMTERRVIDCTPGDMTRVIDEVQSACCWGLFCKDGKLMRRAPDGNDYAVTAIWFTDWMMRRCQFVVNGKPVKPPSYLYAHIKARLTPPIGEPVTVARYPRGFKPDYR